MDERIERARSHAARAADETDNADVREQLRSIAQGLESVDESEDRASEDESEQEGNRLQQVEEKLAGLTDRSEGSAREHIERARDAIDVYRQEDTRDW